MLKKFPIATLMFLTSLLGSVAFGEDLSTHRAYRVTSYNLGVILEVQEKKSRFTSNNYRPLMITSAAADVLNTEHQGTVSWVETNSHTTSTSGVAVSAQFKATDKISFQGAFGVTRNLWAPDSLEYENESGWEANLGIIYKLVDNLSYELHFGYLDTGDIFTDQSTYTDVENIIMVSNRLTMSF